MYRCIMFAEIAKVQAMGKIPQKDVKYVDIYREKPIKVTVKVLVPVREHPKVKSQNEISKVENLLSVYYSSTLSANFSVLKATQ